MPRDPIYAPDGRTWYETALAEAEKRGRMEDALRPFAAIGQWLFARPEVPDDQEIVALPGINGFNQRLTRGDFKAAHSALYPKSKSEEQ